LVGHRNATDMSDELVQILKYAFAGGGGVTIWKLVENWQKSKLEATKDDRELQREETEIIQQLRDKITTLEVDLAKKETALEYIKKWLRDGTLAEHIKADRDQIKNTLSDD
jgi:hypothetical protein